MKYSKLLTIALSIVTALFIVSLSISVPILIRPFYYVQIDALCLEESAELSRTQIITAYNEMMDFCIGATKEFATGELEWSESGKSHFVDVRELFVVDFVVLIVTNLLLITWLIIKKYKNIRAYRFGGRGPATMGSLVLLGSFMTVGLLAAIDFDKAFVVFHSIFFPGKDNWVFDYDVDQIIRILPEEFFRNCAILILTMIVTISVGCIIVDWLYGRKNKTS